MTDRQTNYDLLRVICCVAVITIHVSSTWINSLIEDVVTGTPISIQNCIVGCVFNSISRFAVPCFLMLSGSFILSNQKTGEYRCFYSKSFK